MPVPIESNSSISNPEDVDDFDKLFGERATSNSSALNQGAPGATAETQPCGKAAGFGMVTVNEAGYGSWLDDEPLIQSSSISVEPSSIKSHEDSNVQLVH